MSGRAWPVDIIVSIRWVVSRITPLKSDKSGRSKARCAENRLYTEFFMLSFFVFFRFSSYFSCCFKNIEVFMISCILQKVLSDFSIDFSACTPYSMSKQCPCKLLCRLRTSVRFSRIAGSTLRMCSWNTKWMHCNLSKIEQKNQPEFERTLRTDRWRICVHFLKFFPRLKENNKEEKAYVYVKIKSSFIFILLKFTFSSFKV